jgi:hypothetical protein
MNSLINIDESHDYESFDLGLYSADNDPDNWKDLKEFETFLTKRNPVPEQPYGIFDKDITVCKFFEDKKGETILSEILQKNTETGMGNVVIPNTKIKLVNYSYCPKCNKIFTQKMLINYYKSPTIRPGTSLRHALRKETRVICDDCETAFLPTLIIVDGTPKNDVQYLCRNQVIDAIEIYMEKNYGEKVLTKNPKNIRVNKEDKLVACANDLQIAKLEKSPTLISNFIQYSPVPLILSFIEGKNIEFDDIVFNTWQKPKTVEEVRRMEAIL